MTESLLNQYETAFEALMNMPVYELSQAQKEQALLPLFEVLHHLHRQHCCEYRRITQGQGGASIIDLQSLPYLAVRLFKQLRLSSVTPEAEFKLLQSSGTTGAQVAQVVLDRATSSRQSKVLVKIMQQTLGKQRLPMLIIDSPSVLKDKQKFSARGAGIQGMAFFGRDHTYALDEDMQPNWQAIDAFAEKYQGQPVLIFGFTFMVWLYFVQALQHHGRRLSLTDGILIHSGGWKKLVDQQVDNERFKSTLLEMTGIRQCFNFYGMAEQVGSVFVECHEGHLHAPIFADVIVRDPFTFKPAKLGQSGLLQVLSIVPTSYPGHSLLTEDLGSLLGVDDCPCGRKGKYFSVQGRLPKTELRGCSDTHQEQSGL